MIDISLVYNNGKYTIRLSGELTYDHRSITDVEKWFGIDMAAYFADAVREACMNNGLLINARNEANQRVIQLDNFFDIKNN